MIDALYFYVSLFCSQRGLSLEVPGIASDLVAALAAWYVVPAGLMLVVFVYWFGGTTATDRMANQRAVLRGLLASLIAGVLAKVVQSAWLSVLGSLHLEESVVEWACWQGPPSACSAAATGFALGAMLWWRDWRWGLVCNLAVCVWTVAQVFVGVCYPLDVFVGAVIGVGLAWLLRSMSWLDHPLDVLIRLARRLMLA